MRNNAIFVFAVHQNGSETKWIENGSERNFKWIENGLGKDLVWIKKRFETIEFNVEDDLPFPLNLPPTLK
jgi:hypothetical protein